MFPYLPDFSRREKRLQVPFFEHATSEQVPGMRTGKGIPRLQTECTLAFNDLGATNVQFDPVIFQSQPNRYGYLVNFQLKDDIDQILRGRIHLAALPLETETESKKNRALAAALYQLREWLEAQKYMTYAIPGVELLAPWLVLREDGQTLIEAIASNTYPSPDFYIGVSNLKAR